MESLSVDDITRPLSRAAISIDSPDFAGGGHREPNESVVQKCEDENTKLAKPAVSLRSPSRPSGSTNDKLQPFPFYYYVDHSRDIDPDPLAPVTPPGRVPNFPAKMHAILSRADFSDIICWMPHGRAWKILKPREFEIRVIPIYFEHAKFSSFIRQANGWGFRRLTKGENKNCYMHPLFLRGLPHLCKKMKRPGISKKVTLETEYEPDLSKISNMYPVPEKYTDDSVLLQCTLQGGPKARMPIYTGLMAPNGPKLVDFQPPSQSSKYELIACASTADLTPRDQEALNAFQTSLGASERSFGSRTAQAVAPSLSSTHELPSVPKNSLVPLPQSVTLLPPNSNGAGPNKMSTLAAANHMAFPSMAAMFQANAASQFAAGFAAAMQQQQQFQHMFNAFSASLAGQGSCSCGSHPPAMNPFGVAQPTTSVHPQPESQQ